MPTQTLTVALPIVCTGCAGCAAMTGIGAYLWVSFIVMTFMLCVTSLDLFFMWRRCNKRKKLIASKLHKRREKDGSSN